MAGAVESDLAGKRQSIANVVANVVSDATPFTSMQEKRERPKQVLHTWQVKGYPQTGHRGVLDNKDATEFKNNARKEVQCRGQKTWYNPAVSDFADETEIAGIKGGSEMAEQIADAIVAVAFQIEKRALSNEDTKADDGVSTGNETRGAFQYILDTAQTLYPIDSAFRTPAGQIYSGTLANFGQAVFEGQCQSSYKQRKGPFAMHAFLGVELKGKFTDFSQYQPNVNNMTPIGQFIQEAKSKKLIKAIDQLVMDTGTVDLHITSFLYTDASTGADSAYTHKSGIVVDMNMTGLAYTRKPRVIRKPYDGGGQKAIVDAIFLNMFDNVLGAMAMKISA
jgi:hypothetical protein